MRVLRTTGRLGGTARFACLLGVLYAAAVPALEYRLQELTLEAGATRRVTLPAGYILELLTAKLDGPRLLTFAANGDLFIGSKSGKVYRLAPPYTHPGVSYYL